MTGAKIEREVKFYLPHLGDIRERLILIGGKLTASRHLQQNWRFDRTNGDLGSAGVVLRLRQDTRSTLTYKHPLQTPELRKEIQVEVDDLSSARSLLEALGFNLVASYEKYREVFSLDSAEVMLDELPFGCFIEIEAESIETLMNISAELDLDWNRRVWQSYMELFMHVSENRELESIDANFALFADLPEVKPRELGVEYANLHSERSK
jgi:adenylate cyclase class 2